MCLQNMVTCVNISPSSCCSVAHGWQTADVFTLLPVWLRICKCPRHSPFTINYGRANVILLVRLITAVTFTTMDHQCACYGSSVRMQWITAAFFVHTLYFPMSQASPTALWECVVRNSVVQFPASNHLARVLPTQRTVAVCTCTGLHLHGGLVAAEYALSTVCCNQLHS